MGSETLPVKRKHPRAAPITGRSVPSCLWHLLTLTVDMATFYSLSCDTSLASYAREVQGSGHSPLSDPPSTARVTCESFVNF